MADSFQEKTEAPTPKRREQAREEGQVPRSKEVSTAIFLLAGAGIIHMAGAEMGRAITELFGYSTRMPVASPAGLPGMVGWLREVGWSVLGMLAPALVSLTGIALVVGGVQARGVLTVKPLMPRASHLAPHKNLGRIFGVQSLVELAKSLLKFVIVGVAVYLALATAWSDILALAQQSPLALLEIIQRYAVRVLLYAGVAFLGLAAADYGFQIWKHEKDLRMTKQEIKDEHKQTEGDAMVKARIRSMGRSFARRQMFQEVPAADVVVTNPTHIAAALKYDPAVADAPIVVALGQRKVAERIKRIAREAGVPVIENKPLARALLATAKVGLPIPTELYMAVAEVLAFVYRQRGQRGAKA